MRANAQETVFFADFHLHGPYSIGASRAISVESMVLAAKKIGLTIIGTGDILHPRWFNHLKNKLTKRKEGLFQYRQDNICFVLTGEIEDIEGIHHLIMLPSFESVIDVRKTLFKEPESKKNDKMGRPKIYLNGVEIIEIIHDYNGLIGPAHSFTPFKSIFRENRYKDIEPFYKNRTNTKADFIELGLSANSELADRIKSLWSYPFLSNSDSHSTLPGKIGREFNILKLEDQTFENIRYALKGCRNAILGNVGLDPRLGKYYRSFCYKCRKIVYYSNEEHAMRENSLHFEDKGEEEIITLIKKRKIHCPYCGGLIKLGVRDRIKSIATTYKENKRRPPYYNIVPLIEAIRVSLNLKQEYSKKTVSLYNELIYKLGTEIEILFNVPLIEIAKVNKILGEIIALERVNALPIIDGGGGHYGHIDVSKIEKKWTIS